MVRVSAAYPQFLWPSFTRNCTPHRKLHRNANAPNHKLIFLHFTTESGKNQENIVSVF